jgi:predicted MarR family transcription regulator
MSALDWSELAPRLLHPMQVAIIEALLHMDRALSPVELSRMIEAGSLNNIAYHVRRLAKLDVLELTTTTPRRGAVEHHYRLKGMSV